MPILSNITGSTEVTKAKRTIFIDLVVGIAAITLLLVFKICVLQGSFAGRWIDAKGYEVLHKVIPPFSRNTEPSVVVLDISDLKREPDGTTPTKTLRTIVEALVARKAKAIAIDIDFSSRVEFSSGGVDIGPRSEDDEEFFKFLHSEKAHGVNIVVGVFSPSVEASNWLTPPEYYDLAADMTLSDEDTTRVPKWMKCENGQELKSISMSLAQASNSSPAINFLFPSLLEDPESKVGFIQNDANDKPVPCEKALTFVNYAKLEYLETQNLEIPTSESEPKTVGGRSMFENKLVIIGNTQRGMSDCFVVPGQTKPVAGAYVHASAVYSLVDEPVYRFRPTVVVILDTVLGLFVVLGLFQIRWRHLNDEQFSHHVWEGRFILLSIVITFGLGLLLVRVFNIPWLDFSVVVAALLMHSQVQEGLRLIPKSLRRRRQSQQASK